jgi:WD40 repeat protein
MRKYKFLLVFAFLLQLTCGPLTVTTIPATPSPATTEVESSAPPSPSTTNEPSATLSGPVKAQPVNIGADSFAKAKILHEYWPDVQKAAGLYETIRFGKSQTGWALSPDGRYIAVAGCDAEAVNTLDLYSQDTCEHTTFDTVSHAFLYVFDALTGKPIAKLPETGQALTVGNLLFTPDGSKLVYTVYPSTIHIWDMETAQVETTFTDESPYQSPYGGDYEISPDGRFLAIGSDTEAKIWDLDQKKIVKELGTYGLPVFSSDGHEMLLYNYPLMTIYDTSTWQKIREQEMMPDGIHQYFDVSPDLSLLAVCETLAIDEPVGIWDTVTAAQVHTLKNEVGKCRRLFFTPDGKYLLLFNNHGTGPAVWRVADWKYYRDTALISNFVETKADVLVDQIQFSQDGRFLVVATFSRLTLYELPEAAAPEEALEPTQTAAVSTPAANSHATQTLVPGPKSCSAMVTGSLDLNGESCVPGGRANIVDIDHGLMSIYLLTEDGVGVVIHVPSNVQKHLVPGEYVIGDAYDAADEWRMTTQFNYYEPGQSLGEYYFSYAETGKVVITAIGSVISGTFEFGAHDKDGRQINVKGSFENIPFNLDKP